jgi:galactose mutarotase-like enzyme
MRVGRDRAGWLELSWAAPIQDVGLWITYGAWPEAGGHQEIAIEPQSAPADDLGQAIAAGASPLAAGETRRWQVTLRMLP